MQRSIPIRDPANNIRVFDLSLDSNGNVVIEVKVGKIKVSTPLAAVLSQAEALQMQ